MRAGPRGRKPQCNQSLCQITGQRHNLEFVQGPRERSLIMLTALSHEQIPVYDINSRYQRGPNSGRSESRGVLVL